MSSNNPFERGGESNNPFENELHNPFEEEEDHQISQEQQTSPTNPFGEPADSPTNPFDDEPPTEISDLRRRNPTSYDSFQSYLPRSSVRSPVQSTRVRKTISFSDSSQAHTSHSSPPSNYPSPPLLSPITDEGDSVTSSDSTFTSYRRRWYILLVYSLLTMTQNFDWNTFGPISATLEKAYDLDHSQIALLASWYSIMYLICLCPFIFLVERKGLRMPVAMTAGCVAAGAFIRTLHLGHACDIVFLHLGQILNGIAAPVTFFAYSSLSSSWFPSNQRSLATALSSAAAAVGVSISYFGPHFIKLLSPITKPSDDMTPNEVTHEAIRKYLYMLSGFSAIVLYLVIVFFPSRPPTPPSLSAQRQSRQRKRRRCISEGGETFVSSLSGFRTAFKSLLRNRNAWYVASFYAICAGIFSSWQAILSIATNGCMSEIESANIGVAQCVSGIFSSIAVAWIADRIDRAKWKMIVIGLTFTAGCTFTVFSLHCTGVMHHWWNYVDAISWVSAVSTAACLVSTGPILWELACESLYPLTESMITGYLTGLNNIVCVLFLLACMIKPLGTEWLNWAVVAAIFGSLPLLVIFKPSYNRHNIDNSINTAQSDLSSVDSATNSQNDSIYSPPNEYNNDNSDANDDCEDHAITVSSTRHLLQDS